MSVILMMRGLPASGKTTIARRLVQERGFKRVSKDDLRDMIDFGEYSKENEKFIRAARDAIVSEACLYGYDIVIDDTNLNPKHTEWIAEIADEWQYQLETFDLTTVPVEECIRRDAQREDSVGADVIRSMYERYLA